MNIIKVGCIVEEYLKFKYPNQWVVIAYEPSYDKDKQTAYWDVIKNELKLKPGEFDIQSIIDFGAMLILCANEEEGRDVFEKFPDPEVKGYCCLFGPLKMPENANEIWSKHYKDLIANNPNGMILTENT